MYMIYDYIYVYMKFTYITIVGTNNTAITKYILGATGLIIFKY